MTLEAPSERNQIGGVLYTQWSKTVTDPVNAAARTGVYDVRAFHRKHIKLFNNTDQTVVFTIESCDDEAGTDPRTINSTISLAAAATDEVVITDPQLYLQVKYDPAADSTGTVVIKVEGQRGGN